MNVNVLDFVHRVRTRTYSRDEVIFTEGDPSDGLMYFVFNGLLSVTRQRADGNKQITSLNAGNFFGELALVRQCERAMTVRVKSPEANLGLLDKEIFLKLSRASPEFLYALLGNAIERHIRAEDKLDRLTAEVHEYRGLAGHS